MGRKAKQHSRKSGKVDVLQSAVIPYRPVAPTQSSLWQGGIEVALISAVRGDRWLVPKGHLERGLLPHESAEQEAYEEAGLLGRAEAMMLGQFTYRKNGKRRIVTVHPMAVFETLHDWPEASQRRRRWVSPDEAMQLVCFPELATLIGNLADMLRGLKAA